MSVDENFNSLEMVSKGDTRPREPYEAIAASHQNNSLSISTFSEPVKNSTDNFSNPTSASYQTTTTTHFNQNLSNQLSSFASSYAQMKNGNTPKQAYVNNGA